MVTATQDEFPQPREAGAVGRGMAAVAMRAAGGRWAVWVLRTLVWAVLTGAALLLVRLALAPSAAQLVDTAVDRRLAGQALDWPDDEARAAASHHVADALTLHDGGQASTSRDASSLDASSEVTQVVETVAPGRVEIIDEVRANVEVAARVRTVVGQGSDAEVQRHWRWVAVPVIRTESTVVAAGGLTEIPPPPAMDLPTPTIGEVDSSLTTETRDLAQALFTAWGDESRTALDALTDGSIPLLSADIEFVEVERWQVARPSAGGIDENEPTHLSGQADVTWRQPGDVLTRQTYAVQLERDAADRWRVTDLGPAHPHPKEH